MTGDRSRAYGRVMSTLEELADAKLQPAEVDRIRSAADTLLFSEDVESPGVREALDDVADLVLGLVESERWTEERARTLAEDIGDCGPLASVS